jgi:3-hydroxyisobutyrate dehydrogenase
MTTVAVLGTGIMGAPMARNLAAAGLTVRAWNRTPDKAAPLSADGVEVAATAADAVRGAEVILTMLADADAVAETIESAADGLTEGQIWVQCSTVGIAGCDRLAGLAERFGLVYVDAPVLGTRQPAEKGELTVLASGPDAVRERLTPLFDAIGSTTRWLGDAGQGSRLKLVLNSWLLALTTATAEAMSLAGGLGIDPSLFLSSIRGGPLDVAYAQLKGQAMLDRSFAPAFPVWGAAKDAALVVEAAAQAGARMKVAEAVRDQMSATAEAGHADEDMAAVYLIASGAATR